MVDMRFGVNPHEARSMLATFLVYLPAVNGGRLWDDDAHITAPELRSLHGLYQISSKLRRRGNITRCCTPTSGSSTSYGATTFAATTW